MNFFERLMTMSPDQIVDHVKTVGDDIQLQRYYRRVITSTMDCEFAGDKLDAEPLESLWKSTFSREEQRLIWS